MFALLFVLTACAEGVEKESEKNVSNIDIQWLLDANPREDALKAIGDGKIFLYGVRGPSMFIPGVPQEKYPQYIKKYKIRMIRGTSDAYFGEDFGRKRLKFHLKAVEYAEIFNATMLGNL